MPDALQQLRGLVREITGAEPKGFAREASWDELGLDSLQRLELLVLIEERYGVRLSDTYIWVPQVGDLVDGMRAGAA